jgi:WD40 repeat protein
MFALTKVGSRAPMNPLPISSFRKISNAFFLKNLPSHLFSSTSSHSLETHPLSKEFDTKGLPQMFDRVLFKYSSANTVLVTSLGMNVFAASHSERPIRKIQINGEQSYLAPRMGKQTTPSALGIANDRITVGTWGHFELYDMGGKELGDFGDTQSEISSVCGLQAHPDKVFFTSDLNALWMWNFYQSQTPSAFLKPTDAHGQFSTLVSFRHEGLPEGNEALASGTWDGLVKILAPNIEPPLLTTLNHSSHRGAVKALVGYQNSPFLISAGANMIRVWNPTHVGQPLVNTLDREKNGASFSEVTALALFSNGALASGHQALYFIIRVRTIKRYHLSDGTQ